MSTAEAGTLYLVPTPIGNLQDITERAVEILKNADIIACEDTRHTRILMNSLGIAAHVESYHEHNKKEAGSRLIEALLAGQSVAQVSDAGMPVISDPGADLVRLALEKDIPIVPLPGPNAALTALIASGLDARHFAFIGFLPKITAKRKKLLSDISRLPMTLIFYEAPHRLKATLSALQEAFGNRRAVTARELTKKFETFERSTLKELRDGLEEKEPRGEYVILVEGWDEEQETEASSEISWQEAAAELQGELSLKEIARQISVRYHMSRREVYQYLLKEAETAEPRDK